MRADKCTLQLIPTLSLSGGDPTLRHASIGASLRPARAYAPSDMFPILTLAY